MKKLVIFISISLFAMLTNIAQQSFQMGYYIDGIRNSDNYYYGTARSMALGGAFSSLGGDLGSVQINPAGFGVYRNSEFEITPGMYSLNSNSKFYNTNSEHLNYKFNLSNLGMVFNFKPDELTGWEGVNLSFGYNKLNNLNNTYYIKGNTQNTSLMNEFVSYSNNTHPNSLNSYFERLAYDAYLINPDSNLIYSSPFINKHLQQSHTMESKGSIGEYYMGLGANYDNKLYVGISFNIRSGYYTDTYLHKEVDINNEIAEQNFTFNNELYSWVRGWNFKLGAIYRPIETIRLGLSIHTPTIVEIEQEMSTAMIKLDDNNNPTTAIPTDENGNNIGRSLERYTITTPLRAILGFAYMFQDKGLISFDYEYADYSQIKFSEGDYTDNLIIATEENKKALRATHNFRTGAEAKLKSFYLRGGFAYYASPYASGELNKDANTLIYSTGIGYRDNSFSLDFGYSLLMKTEKYMLYNDTNLQPATLDTKTGTFLLTAGFRF
jgi:hypothetical protein